MSENTAERTTRRKVREGLVVSDKMNKTITVMVEDRVKHPLYGKVMTKSVRLKAHDENNEAGMGDRRSDHGDPSAVGHQALAPRRGSSRRLSDWLVRRSPH